MEIAEQNAKNIYRFMAEIWSQGNMETLDEILDDNFNFILAFAHLNNKEEFKGLVKKNRSIFENLTYNVDDPEGDIVASNTKGACFWRMTTTKHSDTWRNVPASNNSVSIKGITFFKFTPEGKMIEARVQNDVLSMMKQINGLKMLYE